MSFRTALKKEGMGPVRNDGSSALAVLCMFLTVAAILIIGLIHWLR